MERPLLRGRVIGQRLASRFPGVGSRSSRVPCFGKYPVSWCPVCPLHVSAFPRRIACAEGGIRTTRLRANGVVGNPLACCLSGTGSRRFPLCRPLSPLERPLSAHLGRPQVVNDFRKVRRRLKKSQGECTRSLWHKAWETRLYAKTKESKKAAAKAVRFQKITRGTAYQFCRAMDHQRALYNISTATFVADLEDLSATLSLRQGEKRYFVEVEDEDDLPFELPPSAKLQRCILQLADGSRQWEVPEYGLSGRPHITLCGDQGGERAACLDVPTRRSASSWVYLQRPVPPGRPGLEAQLPGQRHVELHPRGPGALDLIAWPLEERGMVHCLAGVDAGVSRVRFGR